MIAGRFVPADLMRDKARNKLPRRRGSPGRAAADSRLFPEAVPRRDLPPEFGSWNSIFVRFRRRTGKGAFEGIFKELSRSFDLERAQADSTAVRARRLRAAKGRAPRAIPGRVGDKCRVACRRPGLPGSLQAGSRAGARSCGPAWIPEPRLAAKPSTPTGWRRSLKRAAAASSNSNRKVRRDHDREMHEWRRQFENFLAKIREFRAIATRCDKTADGFRASIDLVAGVIAARRCQANRGR